MAEAAEPRARTTISWGVLDQVVSSAATFAFIIIAATQLEAVELGAVAFTFEFYLLSIFIARGVTGDPLVTRFAGLDAQTVRRGVRAATTVALSIGVLLGLVLATIAAFVDQPLRGVLLVAAVAVPGLAVQDFLRSALIVDGRVKAAFWNDTFWAVAQVPALLLVGQLHPTAPAIMGAWAAVGCVAALIGLVQVRAGFGSPSSSRWWLRETRDLWPFFVAENMVFQVASITLMLVVSATAGLAATAGFRIAMTVYAPLSLIGRGVVWVAVAMLARFRDDPTEVRRRATAISAALTPLALAWGLLMLLVPTSLGDTVFGDTWRVAEPLVFLASFVCAGGLFGIGMVVGLRALGAGKHALGGRLAVSIGAAAAAAAGGLYAQERGVFEALAWFFPVQVAIWWWLLRDATRRAVTRVSENGLDVE